MLESVPNSPREAVVPSGMCTMKLRKNQIKPLSLVVDGLDLTRLSDVLLL